MGEVLYSPPPSVAGEPVSSLPTDAEATLCRQDAVANNLTSASGSMRLAGFTARRKRSISNLRVLVGASVGSGVTLLRLGLWRVTADRLVPLGATPNDVTGLVINTPLDRAMSAAATIEEGQRYAIAVLSVGTASPQFAGLTVATALAAGELARDPLLAAQLVGLADLPSGEILRTSLSNVAGIAYAEAR